MEENETLPLVYIGASISLFLQKKASSALALDKLEYRKESEKHNERK